jgi:hypothetical protein
MSTEAMATELLVRNESIQSLYTRYQADRFGVNRRYQRKLVWSVEEKQKLADSILQNMPIPLFLVAEIGLGTDASFEVIDGMQRLNAIFAFLENEFPVDGRYFELDALADTKSLKDAGKLQQSFPILDRGDSVRFANYTVALSIFRALDGARVDEVFRRINSGGRRLSFQELRQAGTISPLADLVRIISSRVRGDTSPGDVVPLKLMPRLSITNRDLDYGVQVEEIFWVRHGILRREDVRTSLDEQLVLDILIDCVMDPLTTVSKETRDEFYDFADAPSESGSKSLAAQITTAIDTYGRDTLERDFMRVYDVIREIIDEKDDKNARFATTIGIQRGGRAPRYFHGVFIAIFELMFRDQMRVKDPKGIARKLEKISTGALKIPPGSDWTGEAKRGSIDAVKGVLAACFEEAAGDEEDFGRYGWASQVETLLGNAAVEQQLFEFKQGFLRLDSERNFDDALFERICETLTAMANTRRGSVGYVVLGISNKPAHTQRIAEVDGVSVARYRDFEIVGLNREAKVRGISANEYWGWIVQKLRDNSKFDSRLAAQIAGSARFANYRDLSLGILKVCALAEPTFYGQSLFERAGSETRKVETRDYGRLFSRLASA